MTRGEQVRAMLAERDWPPLTAGMLVESANLLDRLDRMNDLLNNRDNVWVEVVHEDGEVILTIDKLVDTARATALAYGRLVSELRQLGVAAKSEVELDDADQQGEVDPLAVPDEFTARRSSRTA